MLVSIFWAGFKGGLSSVAADLLLSGYNKMASESAPAHEQDQECAPGSLAAPAPATHQKSGPLSFVDLNKTAAFVLWSGFYCGSVLKILYNDLFPRFFPVMQKALVDGKTVMTRHPLYKRHVVCMVLVDNFVSTPFFFNPSYFAIKSVLEGKPSDTGAGVESPFSLASVSFCLERAYRRYREEWFAANRVTWGFWIPIHFVTFSVIPPYWRTPFVAWCSAFTLCAQSINQTWLEEERSSKGLT